MSFDPKPYLSKLSRRQKTADGQWKTVELDYLEVKWRLLWLRSEFPDARETVEIVQVDAQHCIARARYELPTGAVAEDYGSETPDDWKDYIEKACTKAKGRALAALGFGTQFCEDFDFGGDEGKVVDAPVPPRPSRPPAAAATTPASPATRSGPIRAPSGIMDSAGHPVRPATNQQLAAIIALGTRLYGITPEQLAEMIHTDYGCVPEQLTAQQAAAYYNKLASDMAATRPSESNAKAPATNGKR